MTTTTAAGIIDIKQTYFDYPELTKISGEPTLAALIKLRNELKANAQAVPTTLGGGAHGHLGLVVADSAYQRITNNVAYVRPTLPTLNINNGDSQYVLSQKRHEYDTKLSVYREHLAVERILIQQIVNAMESKYLKALRERVTNRIDKKIPEILRHLFETYGDVSPQELLSLRSRIENMVFDPHDPVDEIFTEIDEYAEVMEIVGDPVSESHKCQLAYIVLLNTRTFKSGLRDWDKKVQADKTWDKFKEHFREVQKYLRRTRELTIEQTLNNDQIINMVSDGILEKVNNVMQTMTDAEKENKPNEANTNETLILALTQEVQNMGRALAAIQQNQHRQNGYNPNTNFVPYHNQNNNQYRQHLQNTNPTNNTNQNQRQNQIDNMQFCVPKPQRWKNLLRYCHSCGACDHWSSKCLWKKPGHKNSASWRNKKGGCLDLCNVD